MNKPARLGTYALTSVLCVGCGDSARDATAPLNTLATSAEGDAALSCRAHYGVVEEWYWDRGDGTAVEGSGVLSRNCDDPEDPNCAPRFSYQLWQYDGSWSRMAEGSYDVPLENIRGDGIDTLAFEIEPDEGIVQVAWARTMTWADTWTDEDGFYGDYSASVTGEVLGVPVTTGGGSNPMVSMSAYGCPEPPAGTLGPSRALAAPPRVAESREDGPGSLDRLFEDLDLWRERSALQHEARSP